MTRYDPTKVDLYPEAEVVYFTPAMASALLEHTLVCHARETGRTLPPGQYPNRAINRKIVNYFRTQMESGQWTLPSLLGIDRRTGQNRSGFKRLVALSECDDEDISIPFIIVLGEGLQFQIKLDEAVSGRAVDVVNYRLHNKAESGRLVDIAKCLMYSGITPASRNDYLANADVEKYIEEKENLLRKIMGLSEMVKQKLPGVPASVTARLISEGLEVNEERTRFLFTRLAVGDNLPENSPLLVARNQLIEMRSGKTRKEYTAKQHVIALAFEKYLLGEARKNRFPPGRREKEVHATWNSVLNLLNR